MNRTVFFEYVRNLPFGGRLTPDNVEGLNKILDYNEAKYKLTDNELAYVLASVFHETDGTMQPVREKDNKAGTYLRSKKYYPWFGRGLIQITWEPNYKKFGIKKPDDALQWPTALHVLFEGMTKGMFTGKKLSDFFGPDKEDPVWARSIVNGKRKGETLPDKAQLIRDHYNAFKNALEASQKPEKAEEVAEVLKNEDRSPEAPEKLDGDTTKTGIGVTAIGGIATAVIGAISNPWALGAFAICAIGLFLIYSGRLVITKKAGV